jgi:putative transposase
LFEETMQKHGVVHSQLTLHADRGAAMTAKTTAQLLADLGVTRSHSRPYTSNDNPFSEAAFKTIKYHPTFPAFFLSIESAKDFLRSYFYWYNHEHHHTALALMTPNQVHYGEVEEIRMQRQSVLDAAYQANPMRFRNIKPIAPKLPEAVWINPPNLSQKGNKERTK